MKALKIFAQPLWTPVTNEKKLYVHKIYLKTLLLNNFESILKIFYVTYLTNILKIVLNENV